MLPATAIWGKQLATAIWGKQLATTTAIWGRLLATTTAIWGRLQATTTAILQETLPEHRMLPGMPPTATAMLPENWVEQHRMLHEHRMLPGMPPTATAMQQENWVEQHRMLKCWVSFGRSNDAILSRRYSFDKVFVVEPA
jgi:hypothetical protein